MERVIGLSGLSAEARFLDIGGNSLNLVEILKQVKQETGTTPSPRMFFHKTGSSISAISAEIDSQIAAKLSQKELVTQ